MLASAAEENFFQRLTRRVALNIQRILLGEDAGSLPEDFAPREELVINMATARKIVVSPRWEVLIEAELLDLEEEEGIRPLSIRKAIDEALLVNLDLAVRSRVLAAGKEDVAVARSTLRPQVGLSVTGVQIEETQALASFGTQAERTLSGSATLSQIFYSDAAFGNVAIQEYLQEGREYDLETLRLDIVLEAGTTYLDLMRARALERVRKNNVQQIRSNLGPAVGERAGDSEEGARRIDQLKTRRRNRGQQGASPTTRRAISSRRGDGAVAGLSYRREPVSPVYRHTEEVRAFRQCHRARGIVSIPGAQAVRCRYRGSGESC
jgi:hypothetical protein